MAVSDGVISAPLGDEPDGDWYGEVEAELVCATCGHIKEDEELFKFHDAMAYCNPCFEQLGIYPSENYWANWDDSQWDVDDEDSYYGDDSNA